MIIYTCRNCGKRSRKLEPISMSDWLACQDPAEVTGLPVGECPKCYAPIYDPQAEAKISAAREILAALKACESALYGLGNDHRIDSAWAKARAAIAAAETAGLKSE